MESVLVTGGAGYLGACLVGMLLERGCRRVVVYDLLRFGVQSLLQYAADERVEIVQADVGDLERLRAAIQGVDAVVHLAAIVGYPACDREPIAARRVNVDGTRNVVACVDRERQTLVFASTGSTYGSVDGICTEETPISPLSLYGETKVAGEALVVAHGGIVLRLATVFGVSTRLRLDLLVNDLTRQAFHTRALDIYESHFRRTFLHVRDAARAFCIALERRAEIAPGEIFNIGDARLNYTKIDLANLIAKAVPNTIVTSVEQGADKDKRDYVVSYEKVSARLGFRASVSLADGIAELLRYVPFLEEEEVARARNA